MIARIVRDGRRRAREGWRNAVEHVIGCDGGPSRRWSGKGLLFGGTLILADARPTAMAKGGKACHAWVEMGMLVSPSSASRVAKALAP